MTTYYISQSPFGPPLQVEIEGTPPCLFCGEHILLPSMDGPDGPLVCGSCDAGRNRDGSKWTQRQSKERWEQRSSQVEKYHEAWTARVAMRMPKGAVAQDVRTTPPGGDVMTHVPKTTENLTIHDIHDIRELFARSTDANVIRDCVLAIGDVLEHAPPGYQREKALDRLAVVRGAGSAGSSPRVVTKYKNFTISSMNHGVQPFYLDGRFVYSGYNVCSEDGWINVMPGACWFRTIAEAMRGVDCLIEAGGSPRSPYQKDDGVGRRFWKILETARGEGRSDPQPEGDGRG